MDDDNVRGTAFAAGGWPAYAVISGWRASDLRETGELLSGTLFAVQRGAETGRQNYADLSVGIKEDSLDMMNVGSMAYMEPWQYSLTSHQHSGQYNFASAAAVYGAGDGFSAAVMLSAGPAGVENPSSSRMNKLTAYCPVVTPFVREPAYGTLRFMYASSVEVDELYISSDGFDGWIYPNGASYTVNPAQFTRAGNKLVTNGGTNPFVSGNQLKAPSLNGKFLKANPFLRRTSAGACEFSSVPAHTAVAPHSHVVQDLGLNLSLSVNAESSQFGVGSDHTRYSKNCIHWGGRKNEDPAWKTVPVSMKINGSTGIQFSLSSCGGAINPEAKPAHDKIAVMVYVGGRLKEYERVYL